jgi:hypothetical protein
MPITDITPIFGVDQEGVVKRSSLCLSFGWLCLCPFGVLASDLARIDRSVRKEPAYQSKVPLYCLLAFGPKAETRVWLVLDLLTESTDTKGGKDLLHIDRKGNGDLTGPGNCIPGKKIGKSGLQFEAGAITEKDGKTRHVDLVVDVGSYVGDRRQVTISMKMQGGWMQYAEDPHLAFAKRPQNAPIVHFNGPLTARLALEPGLHFSTEGKLLARPDLRTREGFGVPLDSLARQQPTDLRVELGTSGLGEGTFVAVSCNVIPKDVHPRVELAFPSAKGDRLPVKVGYYLKERC